MDSKLWLKTLEERDKGWLIGPVAWSDLEPHSVVSKRFPLQQGSKLRHIDDFSMSMVNATVSMRDQATTDGVDIIAAMMCVFMRSLGGGFLNHPFAKICVRKSKLGNLSPGIGVKITELPPPRDVFVSSITMVSVDLGWLVHNLAKWTALAKRADKWKRPCKASAAVTREFRSSIIQQFF